MNKITLQQQLNKIKNAKTYKEAFKAYEAIIDEASNAYDAIRGEASKAYQEIRDKAFKAYEVIRDPALAALENWKPKIDYNTLTKQELIDIIKGDK